MRGLGAIPISGNDPPVPERFIVKEGEFTALEVMVKLPLKVPAVVGVNRSVIVHVPVGNTVLPLTHVAVGLEKGAPGLPTALRIRFASPVF